jgi:hypothetical protein
LSDGKIETDLSCEVVEPSSPVATADICVRRVPLSTRGDHRRVRWYLRYNLSDRDVEELLVERGVEVDHVTVYRWVQRFTPLLADASRFAATRPATDGTSTRPTSKSMGFGGTSTGWSTITGRSSDRG